MVSIQPIRVVVEREEDGRILASVPDLPGVMAYGQSSDEAIRKVKAIALQVLAEFHGSDKVGPITLAMIAKDSGFKPEDPKYFRGQQKDGTKDGNS